MNAVRYICTASAAVHTVSPILLKGGAEQSCAVLYRQCRHTTAIRVYVVDDCTARICLETSALGLAQHRAALQCQPSREHVELVLNAALKGVLRVISGDLLQKNSPFKFTF
jgi:hypothetical protein